MWRVKSSTKYSPSELLFGINFRTIDDSNTDYKSTTLDRLSTSNNYQQQRDELMVVQFNKLQSALDNQLNYEKYYKNRYGTVPVLFDKEDKVLVYNKHKKIGNKRKLWMNYEDPPYTVQQRINPNVYRVKNDLTNEEKVLNKLYLKEFGILKTDQERIDPLGVYDVLDSEGNFNHVLQEFYREWYDGDIDDQKDYNDDNTTSILNNPVPQYQQIIDDNKSLFGKS